VTHSARNGAPPQPDPRARVAPLDPLQLFSPVDVAERLGISRTQFYRLKDAKRIRTVKIGKLVKVSAGALAEFIESLESEGGGVAT
jgi:excisionase family DNA binding protein